MDTGQLAAAHNRNAKGGTKCAHALKDLLRDVLAVRVALWEAELRRIEGDLGYRALGEGPARDGANG